MVEGIADESKDGDDGGGVVGGMVDDVNEGGWWKPFIDISLSLVFKGCPNEGGGKNVNGGIEGVMGGRPCGVIGIAT